MANQLAHLLLFVRCSFQLAFGFALLLFGLTGGQPFFNQLFQDGVDLSIAFIPEIAGTPWL
jgi:hypothetical protein